MALAKPLPGACVHGVVAQHLGFDLQGNCEAELESRQLCYEANTEGECWVAAGLVVAQQSECRQLRSEALGSIPSQHSFPLASLRYVC